MTVTPLSPPATPTRTLDVTTSTGRALRLHISADRDGLGRPRYAYRFPNSAAQVTLHEPSGKTPYLKVEPPPGPTVPGAAPDWREQERILPLSAETLTLIRVVRAAIDPPFQSGWLGQLLARLHRLL